jgi:3-oxoacyl-[acyl-carrier protein] reductase
MMFDLTGRTALVTGASGGIGGAIAQALHRQGATVAISGTRREALDTLAAKLGERVHVLPCNLSDATEVEALVPSAEAAMGQVDILVANAGITRDNLFVQLRDEDWADVINVNLTATFRLARAATKLMMRKRFGRIIAITSVVGVTGNPGHGFEGGSDRHDQDARRGIRQAQRHRQLHRAGLHRHAHDRCT